MGFNLENLRAALRAPRVRQRRERRIQHQAVRQSDCAFHRLFGATLRIQQLAKFAECVDASGGDWLAFVCAADPAEALFLATVDFCDRSSGCTTDHRAAAQSLVAYLFELLGECSSMVNVRHSAAWPIPELTKAA